MKYPSNRSGKKNALVVPAALLLMGFSVSCTPAEPTGIIKTVAVSSLPITITALPTLPLDSPQFVANVDVEVGTYFVVVFHYGGGNPHNFQEIYDPTMLTLVGKALIADFPITPGGVTVGGGGGRDEFTFKAIKAGETTLLFEGYYVWQTAAHELLSYEITIR